jgi:uncharacterized delta-60 repeat protein
MKNRLLLSGLLFALHLHAAAAPGDLEIPFAPTSGGDVLAAAVQADGKVLIGGSFVTINGTPRIRLARLNPDGTLDAAFNPAPDFTVNAIVVQDDGKILVGGNFNNIDGQPRNALVRLLENGTLDPGFTSSIDGGNPTVFAIKVLEGGKILVGGIFVSVGGQPRQRIARLNDDGTVDLSFTNPGSDATVRALAVQADGKILAGGSFTQMGGSARGNLARLNEDGSLDTGYNIATDGDVHGIEIEPEGSALIHGFFNTIGGQAIPAIGRVGANGVVDASFDLDVTFPSLVTSVAVEPDGDIVLGGSFTFVASLARNRLARVSRDGTPDPGFTPNLNGDVSKAVLYDDGRILVTAAGSPFSQINSLPRDRLARLYPDGSVDNGFAGEADDTVRAAVPRSDGTIMVAGAFSELATVSQNVLGRVNANGIHDPGFDPDTIAGASGAVNCVAIQRDGKILVGGDFTMVGITGRNGIARFHADGTLDSGFDPGANGSVNAILVQPDGKILVAGEFTQIAGTTRGRIARLEADGSIDSTFINPNADDTVYSLALQADGSVLLGGDFTLVNGISRPFLARVDDLGVVDGSYNPTPDARVRTIALEAGGSAVVGGDFATIQAASHPRLARISSTGTVDSTFNPNVVGTDVYSIVVQADGRMIVGGNLTTVNGSNRNVLFRLESGGAIDAGFNGDAGSAPADEVRGVFLQNDGRILVGGTFPGIGGGLADNFARLVNDPATESISIESRQRVVWMRGGAAPEITEVLFELSNDGGTTFTSLGAGTRIAGGWEITGLDLNDEVVVRAVSSARGGQFGGSGNSIIATASFSFTPYSAPELTISGKKRVRTAAARIIVRGTATDADGDLTSVRFIDSRERGRRFRDVSGLASWSAGAKLKRGRNLVQVQAEDATLRKSPLKRITVIRK